LFHCRSICKRNTRIGAKGLWECGCGPMKSFYVVFSISKCKLSGRNDERDDRPKSTRTVVDMAAVVDLFNNDRRIASRMIGKSLNILKAWVLRILKEDLWKRMLCASFVPHCSAPEQKKDRVTSCQDIIALVDEDKNFLTNLLLEMRPGVLPMTPKKSDRALNGLVRHSVGRRKWNSKGLASRVYWYIFSNLKA
jgi:hypothetical protein